MKKYLGLAVLGLMAVTVVAPTFAKDKGLAGGLGTQPGMSQYVTTVGKEVTKGGLTIRLQDMILDNANRSLTVVTEITGEEEIGRVDLFETVYINGECLNTGSKGFYEQIDKHTARVTLTYPLEQAYEGKIEVGYKIKQVGVDDQMKYHQWNFDAVVNGDDLAKATQVIKLDETMTFPNGQKICFTKYTSNVLGHKLYYTTSDSLLDEYTFEVKAYDQEGREVKFEFGGGNTGVGGVFVANPDTVSPEMDMTKLTFELHAQALPEQDGPITAPVEKVGESFTLNGK